MNGDSKKLSISYRDLTKEQLIEIILKTEERKKRRKDRRQQKRRLKTHQIKQEEELAEYKEAKNFFEILQLVIPKWREYKKRRRSQVAHALGQLLKEYPTQEHLYVATRTSEWCLDHKKEIGLSRYRTFLRKQEEWRSEIPEGLVDQERIKTKEYLQKYGDG